MSDTLQASAIPLELFCRKTDGRYHMETPFNRGGYRYATDSKVCIRIETTEEDTADTETPRAETLKWPARVSESKLMPWPANDCYRFEPVKSECEECDADTVEWMPIPASMPLGVESIFTGYHYLISQLPNVRYLPHEQRDVNTAIYFRFDGGEGLLMPRQS